MRSLGEGRVRLSVALLVLALARPSLAEPPTIALVTSHDAAPYREMVAGFREHFAQRGVEARFEEASLDGDANKAAPSIGRLKTHNIALVYALGSLATGAALEMIDEQPVVAGLVLDGEALEQAKNATGVALQFPLETQFKLLKELMPRIRRVGVLYDPAENQEKVRAARAAAKKFGLQLIGAEVRAPKELPAALEGLLRRAEILWTIPDKTVLSSKTAKAVLLSSFRNRVPVVGVSAAWVKAGALYALDWDYRDMGVQTAEVALRLLKGEATSQVPVSGPRKVAYALNLKTAQHMKLEFPAQLVGSASQVFE